MTAAYTYWTISNGFRGCYMPDSIHTVRVHTRRELKEAMLGNDTSDNAPRERAVAAAAAAAWRMWGPKSADRHCGLYPCIATPYLRTAGYALFVGPASKDEWLAAQDE